MFTYFIYLNLLAIMVYFTYKPVMDKNISSVNFDLTKNPKLTFNHYVALLIIAFVVGFRYGVGTDWEGYKSIYEYISYGIKPFSIGFNIPTYAVEWGYYIINQWVADLGGNSEIMFFLVALISWYFIFKSVPLVLLPLFLFFFFFYEIFFWSINCVRQFVAIGFFLYSI